VSRVRASIHIARPRRAVYEFVATPRTWTLWHPGRVAVSGIVDRPPAVGERVTEKLAFAGVQTQLAWEVTARKAPERWSMAAQVPRHGEAALAFKLAPNGKGTLLECEIAYSGVNVLVDTLHVRPRVLAEARTSLARLKQVLEA
jgi:Polyketide cyclase / dehydrase and lipid transport